MYSLKTTVFALAMASTSLAQTSTVTLFIPGADPQSLVASVVASDATATTYAMQCSPGTDSSDCGFPGVVTLTEGPARAQYTFAPEKDENGTIAFEGYIDCSLAGTSSAVCTASYGGTEANDPGVATETLSGTDLAFLPVVITAGPASGSSGSPSSAVPSTTNTGSTSANTSGSIAAAKTSGSGTISSGASQTASASQTAASAGGVAAVKVNAKWALGGAAVVLAMMV